jgi:filamentous hemagglutinin family protein
MIKRMLLLGGFGLGLFTGAESVQAQAVVSDGTVNTIVTRSGNVFTIDNGTSNGTNLFHSFREFSIPTGGSAIFNNAPNIQNIFSRVTGGTVSNIDGMIQAQGGANLFLLNPSGILFGANASLNIGGSFVGTTANTIKFADGMEFSATNLSDRPLLTMSVPIGLQMGQNSGPIAIQGTGHNMLRQSIFAPAPPNTNPSNLSVNPGYSLVLVGNTIKSEGGNLKAPSGRIDIASLSAGQVELEATALGWRLNNIHAAQWSDIALSNASLVDASGSPGGTIHLAGRDITLQDSSTILIQNWGDQTADRISIRAAGTLAIQGFLPNRDQGLIVSETVGPGRGADIVISANKLQFSEGGTVLSATFLAGGQGGDISVKATESITATGFSPIDPSRASGILSSTLFGGGQGGNLSVATQKLNIYGGGGIANLVFGGTGGGNMDVKADTIDLIGENQITSAGSVLTATSFFGGDAGKLRVDAGRILLQNGGVISSSTLNTGTAGQLTIHASESIQVLGRGRFGQESRIAASAEALSLIFQQIFGLPAIPTGNSGNLDIYSPLIQVQDGASIKVDNAGTGTAGRLSVFANTVQLKQQGAIIASTLSGEGGNIQIVTNETLILRQGSTISATSGDSGNGGNITINAPIILGLDNSDIFANAIDGRGGKIDITTQGIIGLEFRNLTNPRDVPTNDISAKSEQVGLDGTVQINTIGVDPNSGLAALPVTLNDPTQQIAQGCRDIQDSSFIISGRGGISHNPTRDLLTNHRPWTDLRAPSTLQPSSIAQAPPPAVLIEATAWRRNPKTGKVELIAAKPIASNLDATCAIAPQP